jgi:diguanylate cyclase (GGDEF)-like protein
LNTNMRSGRANALLRFVSLGNRAAIRAEKERELLDSVCIHAVATRICASAQILLYTEIEGGACEPVSQAGIDLTGSACLTEIASAMATPNPLVLPSLDSATVPGVADLEALGMLSLLVLPIQVEGKHFGALALVDTEFQQFPESELSTLMQFAGDLGFAIETMRARKRQDAREQMATHLLEHDAATGLPTRTLLKKHVDQLISGMAAKRSPLAVMVLQIDNLREISDTFSFCHGDALLNEVGARLRASTGDRAYLARYSDEGLAVILPAEGADKARLTARALQLALARPCWAAGIEIEPRIRIGIAVFPGHGSDAEILLRRASLACERARETAEGFSFHSGEPEMVNARRVELATDLRNAIEAGDLALYCQPKITLADNSVCGMELLSRWRHPKYGMVPPSEFVPLAEQTGLIKPLTDWVLKTAAADWHLICGVEGTPRFAVNVATRNLLDPWLVERIDDLLATWGIAPSQLQIEITESELMHDFDMALKVLTKLRDRGIELQIDDFGTGHSALSYLQRLPVTTLKIDQSFVRPILTDPVSRDIVRTVIQLAHNIGMKTVAEGIESAEIQQCLLELGCDMGQGFHIARPMPAADFLPWLKQVESRRDPAKTAIQNLDTQLNPIHCAV